MSKAKNKIFGDAFFLTGASIATFIFSIPSSVISAKLLGPSLLGILKILTLIQSYASYSQLGFLNAIKRETSILLGQGNQKKAEEVKDISITNAFILLGLAVVVIWLCYWSGMFNSKNITFLMMLFITITILLNRIRNSIAPYLVATANFKHLAFNKTLIGILSPIFAITFVYYFRSVEGLLFASILTSVIACIIYFIILKNIGFRYRININLKKSLKIWKPNIIIYLNNIAGKLLWTIDILLISIFLSVTEVGWYGVAVAAVKIALDFSHAVNRPILRKMTFERGKFGLENFALFKPYFSKPLTIYIFYCSLWAGIICLSYTWLIHYFLTAYINSIFPLFILTMGIMLYGSMPIFSFYLNVTDQFTKLFYSRIAFIVFNLLINIFVIKSGYGINGVAMVTSLSYALFVIWITVFSYKQIYEDNIKKSFIYLSKLFLVSSALLVFILFYYSMIKDYTLNKSLIFYIPELLIVNIIYVIYIVLLYSIVFRAQPIYKEIINISKTILFTSLRIKEVKA